MTPYTVTVAEDLAGLEALGLSWWALWRRCPEAVPFTSPAWLLPWWRTFSPGRLRAVALWEGRRLVGLAPAYREDGPHGERLLLLGLGLSDALDCLLDPEARDDAAGLLIRGLLDHADDWRTCALEELSPGAAALRLPAPAPCTGAVSPQSARPVLDLDLESGPDAGGLLAVPSRKRRALRMARHRLARRGGTVAAVAPGDAPAFLADLHRLHGARWATRDQDGVLAEEEVMRFHGEALPALAGAGLARLYTVAVEGRVIGAHYGLLHGRRAYAYLGGFDPDHAFESPGTILIGHAIAEAAREGCTTFDFLRGQEAYKYEWGARDAWNLRRIIVRDHA